MRLAACLLLGLTTPALADAEDDLDQLEVDLTPDVAAASAAVDLTTSGTAAGGAAAAGVTAGASIEGNAEWHYLHSYSFARGHAAAAAYVATDGPGVTIDEEAELRPWAFYVFQLELAQRLALDVAPKLSDRPDRWRRRYSSAGFDLDVIGLNYFGERFGAQLIRVDNGFDWDWQTDGADEMRRFRNTADWSPISFTRRAGDEEVGRIDLIALEAHAIDGAHDGVVLTEFYPRLTDVQLGPVWFDAGYGRTSTGWQEISVDGEVVSTITSAELPVIRTPAWRLRLGVHGDVEASAGVERDMHLTADSALVLEERASADVATTVRDTAVSVRGFAARSRIWTSPDDPTDHVTGGGALALVLPPRHGWQLTGSAEIARTFYASIEGDRGLRVDDAVRVDVGLRRELRTWTPRLGR